MPPRSLSTQSGTVFLLIVFIVLTLFIIMMAGSQLISAQYHHIANQKRVEEAFNLAEAGWQYGMWLLSDGGATPATVPPVTGYQITDPVTGSVLGTFDVNFAVAPIPPKTQVTITSTGIDASQPNRPQCVTVVLETSNNATYTMKSWNQSACVVPTVSPAVTPTPTITPSPTPGVTPTPSPTPTPQPPMQASSLAVYNGALYASTYRSDNPQPNVNDSFIFRFDGTEWQLVYELKNIGRSLDMVVYNNQLYVAGAKIFRYDGTNWFDAGYPFNAPQLSVIRVLNNQLYVGVGGLFAQNEEQGARVYRYAGDTNWSVVGGEINDLVFGIQPPNPNRFVRDLMVYNNQLHVSVNDPELQNFGVYRYTGTQWKIERGLSSLNSYTTGLWTDSLYSFNNQPYLSTAKGIFRYDETRPEWDRWVNQQIPQPVPQQGKNNYEDGFVEYATKLSVIVNTANGYLLDGKIWQYTAPAQWTQVSIPSMTYGIMDAVNFNNQLCVGLDAGYEPGQGHVRCYNGSTWTTLGTI